jgi:hypothetical protein
MYFQQPFTPRDMCYALTSATWSNNNHLNSKMPAKAFFGPKSGRGCEEIAKSTSVNAETRQ